ncbi:MAG: imidazole glycerol phosphate synthase subunit HisH [bacterium]|nr:imidazole glycerol phosphate synthase subunit HisH [bacterium]MDE0419238.1 imidazole glycerol phosphate synthase subunit HisH [bacterium]
MTVPDVVVCRTGTANLASVLAALRRAGGLPRTGRSPDEIRAATHVVLPGVGTFGAAMDTLREAGTADALRQHIDSGKPLLAICVGFQLLCRSSEESPGAAGLGLIDDGVARFPEGVRVPQFGWNSLAPGSGCRTLVAGHAYFANSYRLESVPRGWCAAMADHGGPFVAALERDALVACQFHPELSGCWGEALIRRWLAAPC